MNQTSHKEYYYLLDALRGLALINMLLFHFCYDLFVIFGSNYSWYRQTPIHIWQQYICISFLMISGISWHFCRNNLKRGIQLNLYGLLITAVTLVFLPDQTIWFGILNCIGCCTLLLIPFHRVNRHRPFTLKQRTAHGILGFFCSLFLFLITRNITDGYLSFGFLNVRLPDILYTIRPLTILGFPHDGFSSGDYFPVLPWFFLFLCGYQLWEIIDNFPFLRRLLTFKVPVLSVIGRKTIWVYLLHQPVLYALAYLCHHLF